MNLKLLCNQRIINFHNTRYLGGDFVQQNSQSKKEYVKQKTIELYDSLPQDLEERKARTDIRDELISLNYTFFGYVASHTFINNTSVTYEDKLQSAILGFCECWWKYRWQGDSTHRGYRDDLSFAVFFKPRIGEMIERELNEVKYSIRRSLCMEVGKQIGKHWGKVTYDDLSDPRVNLPVDKMNSLKATFGTMYAADLSEHELYTPAPIERAGIESSCTDKYNSIEELLVQEMIRTESKITESKLKQMSDMYQIDIQLLRSRLPYAESILYDRLKQELDTMFE